MTMIPLYAYGEKIGFYCLGHHDWQPFFKAARSDADGLSCNPNDVGYRLKLKQAHVIFDINGTMMLTDPSNTDAIAVTIYFG